MRSPRHEKNNKWSEAEVVSDKRSGDNVSTAIGINHISVSVSDIATATEFYSAGLGVDTAELEYDRNTAARFAGFKTKAVANSVIRFPNGHLELAQYPRIAEGSTDVIPVKGPGVTHVCFQSPSAENIYDQLRSRGATPVSRGDEPVHLLGQGVYYAYARDSDGIMYETEHLDRPPFDGAIWFSHVALVSHDLDRMVEFYSLLLGADPNRRTNSATGPTFDQVANYDDVKIRAAWFDIGNMILEMWQFINPVTPPSEMPRPRESLGYNKVAFEVADLRREYHRLNRNGIKFLSPPESLEHCRELYLRDPDGNLISLIELEADSMQSVRKLKQKNW